jgi:4-hydroxybenzoyl-CoA thioesterase
MFAYERPVHFQDVDAARIVFFPTVLTYCHDAMAALFADLDGGYSGLVVGRGIGLPTVHVDVDFTAPLRFGDAAAIQLEVARIGKSSTTFHLSLARAGDAVLVANVRLICACTDLAALRAVAWPEDVRRILERHLIPSGQG